MNPDVIIIGAGLAGLNCALHLEASGFRVRIFEASDRPGGRVRTDRSDGFLFDRGFQVFLSAYPEAQRVLEYSRLLLKPYYSGLMTRVKGGFRRLSDPFRMPAGALTDIASPVAPMPDLLRLARLRNAVTSGNPSAIFRRPNRSTAAYLREAGFGPEIIERVFRPFFGGVFLDRNLRTSSRMFEFVFRMMATGTVGVPQDGMEAISRQLASRLSTGALACGAPVAGISGNRIRLADDTEVAGRAVVVATDGSSISSLVPQIAPPAWNSANCLYFAANHPPVREPILVLGGDERGPINTLCVPTNLHPGMAPPGAALISTTVLGIPESSESRLVESVREQLTRWFGSAVRHWKYLRSYRIRYALPDQQPSVLEEPERDVRIGNGLYICGDHRDTASINGALASGRRAACQLAMDLDGRKGENPYDR